VQVRQAGRIVSVAVIVAVRIFDEVFLALDRTEGLSIACRLGL